MITQVFHISDLHIFEKNYVNLKNSWKQLVANIIAYPNYKQSILLVITGDIFEYKTYLNSDDVYIFYTMINILEMYAIRTFIIPGNHDYNINTLFSQDNISILLGGATTTPVVSYVQNESDPDQSTSRMRWQYIKCFPKTGTYDVDNLRFWVYSPIDKKIPQGPVSDTTATTSITNIALLHEPIVAAKYDNDESIFNGRFKLTDLAHHDIIMLGDIHRPQFLTPTAAYAGSFVQKNRGEGIDHGYILWDIAKRTGNHVWIPLYELSLKLIAHDNTLNLIDVPSASKITHMSLIHKNCSADWIATTIDNIKKNYDRPINQIIRQETFGSQSSKKLSISSSLDNINPGVEKLSHTDLIKQILAKSKTDDLLVQRILDYHNNFLQNRQPATIVRYYLRYLSWSNVFCYGPQNFINFEEIKGLVALSGRNKTGKSSVIDIIIRILFNECERGHKDDILNKNTKSGFIKCCFTINDGSTTNEYIIEQVWQKYSSSSVFALYHNGENVTKDSLIKTYKYIKEELGLGNYKDFVNLTTALQNRHFIVDLDKKDIYSLLCKLLDIDTMKDIEEHVKKERDFLKREKKAKLKDIDSLGGLAEKDTWEKEINGIVAERNIQQNAYIAIETKLTDINKNICNLNRKIQHVDLAQDWHPGDITCTELPWSQDAYLADKNKIDKLIFEFEINKSKLNAFNKDKIKKIKTAIANGKIDEPELTPDKINELKKCAGAKLSNVPNFKTQYLYEELLNFPGRNSNRPDDTEEIDKLYRLLTPCNSQQIIQANAPVESIDILHEQLAKCRGAKQNFTIYEAQNEVAEEFMDAAGIDGNQFAPIYNKYTTKYNAAKISIRLIEKDIVAKINQWHEFDRILSDNIIIAKNAEIEHKIKDYKLYRSIAHDIECHHLIAENNKIRQAQKSLDHYNDMAAYIEYGKIKDILLAAKEQVHLIRSRIAEWDKVATQNKEYDEYASNLVKFEICKNNKEYDMCIGKLVESDAVYQAQLKSINIKINELDKKLVEVSALHHRYKTLLHNVVEIDDTLGLYDAYYGCINYKTGIPSTILRHTCIILSEQCNRILSNVTDFSVEFIFEDEIKIYTVHKTKNMETKIPASMGSGFQKFILDMIMRIVLTKISNISNPNILFIDEGFGCLDRENFASICNCLARMKDNFDAMIIITHIQELQAYMDMNITITRENDFSKLQFGKMTEETYDICANANLRRIKESLMDSQKNTNIEDENMPIIVEIDATQMIKVPKVPKAPKAPKVTKAPKTTKAKELVPFQSIATASLLAPSLPVLVPQIDQFPCIKSIEKLCDLYKVDQSELINIIYTKMILFDTVSSKYTCIPCNKIFKKIELAKTHICAKTYKAKHFKYLVELAS